MRVCVYVCGGVCTVCVCVCVRACVNTIPLFQLAAFDASLSALRQKSRENLAKGTGPLYLNELSVKPLLTPPAAALDQGKTKRKREEEEQGKKDEDARCLPGLSPVPANPRNRTSRLRRPKPKPPTYAEIGASPRLKANSPSAQESPGPLIASTPRKAAVPPFELDSPRSIDIADRGKQIAAELGGRAATTENNPSLPMVDQLRQRLANVRTSDDLDKLIGDAAATLQKKTMSCPFCDARPEGYYKAYNRNIHMRTRCKAVRIIRENLAATGGRGEAKTLPPPTTTTTAEEAAHPFESPTPSGSQPSEVIPDSPPSRTVFIDDTDDDDDVVDDPAQIEAANRAAATARIASQTTETKPTDTRTAQKYTRALDRVFDGRDVPDFLAGWIPGQLLSHEAMKEILFDKEFHTGYMRMASEMLAEVHQMSQHHFNAGCFTQTYDSAHTSESLEEGLDEWCQACGSGSSVASADDDSDAVDIKPQKGTGIRRSGPQALLDWLKNADLSRVYDTPATEEEMKERFVLFLRSKTARGKTDQLSPVTIAAYTRSMFSTTCHNSVSSYVRKHYGRRDGTDLTSLLFHVDRPTRVLDIGILSHFFPDDPRYRSVEGKEEEDEDADDNDPRFAQQKTAALFVQSASGLIALLDYMNAHAGQTSIEPGNVNAQNRRNDYIQRVSTLRCEVSKKVSQLHKTSAKESKTNRLAKDLMETESTQERLAAYKKYFRGAHYTNSLVAIKNALDAMLKKGPKGSAAAASALSLLEFKRHGFWLMVNLTFFNGARPQVVRLMTNRDFKQRTTVACPSSRAPPSSSGAMKAAEVVFSRDTVLSAESMVSIPLGTTDNRKIGKTGEAEMTLPADLASGLINYSMIKGGGLLDTSAV